MSSIMQLCGDFQQGGCLHKPTTGIQWKLEHRYLRNKHQQKQICQLLAVVYWQLIPITQSKFGKSKVSLHQIANPSKILQEAFKGHGHYQCLFYKESQFHRLHFTFYI